MGGPNVRDWQRLATCVTRRRTALGLTQEDVRNQGGPSTATMRLIEGALQNSYRPAILARLEKALGWAQGSVEAILAGGRPTLSSQGPPPVAPDASAAESAITKIEAALDYPGLPDDHRLDTIRGIIFGYRQRQNRPDAGPDRRTDTG